MKAIGLLSGGLDSTLAIKVILEQGVEVEALNFFSPFCQCNRRANGCGNQAKNIAQQLAVPLKVINISTEFLELVKRPKHGFGKNLNPCIDCRILMLKKAKDYMQLVKASFVITGEVLGQRPMSQHKAALNIVEKESGLSGLILRPLSAKLLQPSIAEQKGWVNREKLLQISGRSRKPQMNLAQAFQIDGYACPAGGCLLTDAGFSRRMKDLMAHAGITLEDVELLKVGRHFRLSDQAKIVVGRDQQENAKLTNLRKHADTYFYPLQAKGPEAIGRGKLREEDLERAAQIVARYCDKREEQKLEIGYCLFPDGEEKSLTVSPIANEKLEKIRI